MIKFGKIEVLSVTRGSNKPNLKTNPNPKPKTNPKTNPKMKVTTRKNNHTDPTLMVHLRPGCSETRWNMSRVTRWRDFIAIVLTS